MIDLHSRFESNPTVDYQTILFRMFVVKEKQDK